MKDDLFSFSNIHRCYLKCRRRKRNTVNALRFEINMEENLCRLERELKTKSYQPARSVRFVVKKPKFREIFAADFRDRIVHHILVYCLERIFESKFIFDSYACRREKGTHNGVKRLQKFARQVTANGTRNAFYLQMDLKSYFASIDKSILLNLIRRQTSNPDILWLAEIVIRHNCAGNFIVKGDPALFRLVPPHKTLLNAPANRGLPRGNLTRQFFANVYLNELDQFVKRDIKVKYYIRYVDDFILLSEDREQLVFWRKKIKDFVREKLKLEIHPEKQRIAPVSNGMDFLGYIVRPCYILVRKRVVRNFKNKMWAIGKIAVKDNILEFQPALVKKTNAVINSYMAHFSHANSYKLKNALAGSYNFIDEFNRIFRLVAPHYFHSLAAQYGFFKKALSGVDFYWDETGQLCFRDRAALIFFAVGRSYAFFGADAATVADILGLKPIKVGGVPPSIYSEMGSARAAFPVALEKKYATLAVSKGYFVYIISEKKDIRFNHKLLTRTLTKLCRNVGNGSVRNGVSHRL